MVRVAAIQATPVVLDGEATVEKACGLLGEAAADGARLAVLPEAFVPLFPSNAWAKGAATFGGWERSQTFGGWDALWERLWENSVDVPGPLTERLAVACREHGIHCAIGVNERESERPGSLYNTLLLLGPEGLLHKHRKLMPTMQERLFHGISVGADLGVVVWVAPTGDDSDGWLASMRHVAIESGAFVVSVPQYIPASAFPDEFPVPLPEGKEVLGNGGAAIIEPRFGQVIAGPLYGEQGTVIADCDLSVCLQAKRWFDVVGHYSREDILARTALAPGAGQLNRGQRYVAEKADREHDGPARSQ
jgi:nitrilase